MAFELREELDAREDVDLLIGLSGGTGSGKTYTAMRLATGMARALGQDWFAIVDTENRRARHYADFFRFKSIDLTPPFTPERYTEALAAAAAKSRVIVVDSMSHEWAGEGGVLEMQEAEFAAMNYQDSKKLLSWVKPKMAHKRMVQRLLQFRAHLILCHRAESKIDMVKEGGRTVVKPKEGLTGTHGWFPVAEKNLAFELTVSLLLEQERPGVPVPIKLQEQHKHLFPLDEPITEETGLKLVEWAAGGAIDWPARIEAAQDLAQLRALRKQIDLIRAAMPESARAIIQTSFNDRLQELQQRGGDQ